MDLGLSDKIVIITGGAGAIGSAAARCFLREGGVVIIGDNDQEHGVEVAAQLSEEYPGQIFFHYLDLSDEQQIRSFVRTIVDTYGGIDVIVNNAAVFFFDYLVDWPSLEPLDNHYQIALRGPTTLVQEAWRCSPRSRAGSVINISSIAGHVGEPKAVAYTMFKAALKGFTLSCAIEMAEFSGWAVSVSPGHTWTPVHRDRAMAQGLDREGYEQSQASIQSTMFARFLDPEQVGEWIVVAASRLGKPLTGQDIRVTNGIEAGGFNRSYETAVE